MLKKISDILYYYDPTREYTYKAILMTTSMCLGALFWMYTHKPCGMVITLVPQFLLIITFTEEKYKEKIIKMVIFSVVFGFAAFAMSVLHEHKIIMIAVIFIISYFIYSSRPLFYLTTSTWMIGTFIELPAGWHEGVNRIFEMGVSFIICFVLIVIYEYTAVHNIIYSTLKYSTELVNDLFCIYTSELDRAYLVEAVKNKYLFEKENISRVDIDVEKAFDSRKDQFYHRVFLVLAKLDSIINNKDFIFGKNRLQARVIAGIYICYRRISRDLEFLENYTNMLDDIKSNLPETVELVANIKDRLNSLYMAVVENNFNRKSLKNEKLTEDWMKKLDVLVNKKNQNIQKEELKVYFGIKCILTDLDRLSRRYQDRRFSKFIKTR